MTALVLLVVLLSDNAARLVNTGFAFAALFLLVVGLAAEWGNIPHYWRWVLVALTVQQAVIAYGSYDAARGGDPTFRVYAVLASLLAIVATTALAGLHRLRTVYRGRQGRRL